MFHIGLGKVVGMSIGNASIIVGFIIILITLLMGEKVGSYFYIGSGFGAGPRDGLMVALTRKTKMPIGLIRSMIELSATIIGWLIGGMVGIGTLISGFAIGFCVQSTFRVLKFKPTEIRHSTLIETFNDLKSGLRKN